MVGMTTQATGRMPLVDFALSFQEGNCGVCTLGGIHHLHRSSWVGSDLTPTVTPTLILTHHLHRSSGTGSALGLDLEIVELEVARFH